MLAALLLVAVALADAGRGCCACPLKWLRPVEGSLAADSLLQAPRRTSATVAALMLSLALVIGQGGIARGSFQSVDEWVNNTLNPDLFVSTSQNFASRDFHFPASMENELRKLPGVAEVQPVRSVADAVPRSADADGRVWSRPR